MLICFLWTATKSNQAKPLRRASDAPKVLCHAWSCSRHRAVQPALEGTVWDREVPSEVKKKSVQWGQQCLLLRFQMTHSLSKQEAVSLWKEKSQFFACLAVLFGHQVRKVLKSAAEDICFTDSINLWLFRWKMTPPCFISFALTVLPVLMELSFKFVVKS